MTDRHRLIRVAVVVATAILLGAGPSAASAEPIIERAPSEPDTSQPITTQPPSSEPPTSEPTTSEPAEPSASATGDDDIGPAAAAVGIVGFLVLVAVAAWWMVKREDDDDAPHPRPPSADDPLPGQDLI